MANDIQNSFLDHRYCNWAFISFPSLAIAPFCIILKTESIFLLLAMAMAFATITAIYSKKKELRHILDLISVPCFIFIVIALCIETSSLGNTFIIEFVYTILGIVYLYCLIRKNSIFLFNYFKNKFLGITTLSIVYFLDIIIISYLFMKLYYLLILYTIISLILFVVFIFKKRSILWYISIYWINLIFLFTSVLCVIGWLLLLVYTKFGIAITIIVLNANFFAWRIFTKFKKSKLL